MNKDRESGSYLRGQEGETALPYLTAVLGGLIIAGLLVGLERNGEREGTAKSFAPPQGASTELTPMANRPFKLVYEGQTEPTCPGDIEKVIPLKDGNGEFRALNIICKPVIAEQAK